MSPSPAHRRPDTPPVTVDVIIEVGERIVLVERRYPPAGWALPGGFVEVGESLAEAATREALEETALAVQLHEQFFAYSDPRRDPRGATVSVVFLGRATGEPHGGDDASRAALFPPDAPPPLAFDHAQILADYLCYRRTGVRPGPRR
jgi:8-oxo-dGTP diphosphatase